MFLITVLILLMAIIIVIHILSWLCCWADSLRKDSLYIKYSDFKKSYNINPNKWVLNYTNVYFKKSEGYYGAQIRFQFYPIGYYKYKLWRNLAEKKRNKASKRAAYQEIMSVIKSDMQYGKLSDVQSPSIEIEVDKKHRDTFIKAIQKYIKEELGMDVKVTNKENSNEQ